MAEDGKKDEKGGLQEVELTAGTVLFKQHDPSSEMYVIKAGKIEVYIERMGKKIPLGLLERGDVLGEMALFDNRPRSASAQVLEDARVIIITREMFDKRLENVPDWLLTIIRILINRLRDADRKIGDTVVKDEVFNTAIIMSYILGKGGPEGTCGELGQLKTELNQVFEIQEEMFGRIMDKMRMKGLLSITQGKVGGINRDILKDYITFLKGTFDTEHRIDMELSDGALEFLNMLLWLADRKGFKQGDRTVVKVDFLHSDTEKMMREFVDNKTLDELVDLKLVEVQQDTESFGRKMDFYIDQNWIKKVVEFKKMIRIFSWSY